MIKLLSRLQASEQSEEVNADVLIEEIADVEASEVSGGWCPWWFTWCRP